MREKREVGEIEGNYATVLNISQWKQRKQGRCTKGSQNSNCGIRMHWHEGAKCHWYPYAPMHR